MRWLWYLSVQSVLSSFPRATGLGGLLRFSFTVIGGWCTAVVDNMIKSFKLIRILKFRWVLREFLRGSSSSLWIVKRPPKLIEKSRDSWREVCLSRVLFEATEGLSSVLFSGVDEWVLSLLLEALDIHLWELAKLILLHILLGGNWLDYFLWGEHLACLVLNRWRGVNWLAFLLPLQRVVLFVGHSRRQQRGLLWVSRVSGHLTTLVRLLIRVQIGNLELFRRRGSALFVRESLAVRAIVGPQILGQHGLALGVAQTARTHLRLQVVVGLLALDRVQIHSGHTFAVVA